MPLASGRRAARSTSSSLGPSATAWRSTKLHFKAEVRELKDFGHHTAKVSDAEVKLAVQLIDHLAAKRFDPNEFSDEHRARVQAEIKKKVQGKEISLGEAAPEKRSDNVINLMDALKASLQKRGGTSKSSKAPKKAPAKKTRRSA